MCDNRDIYPTIETALIFSDAKNEIKHKRLVSESIVPYKQRMDNYYNAIYICYHQLLKIKNNFKVSE